MQRLNNWDWLATLAITAAGVPYIGYLINGSMPFIQDPRGMAGVGLVLGAIAFFALNKASSMNNVERVVAGASLVLGVAAVALAETFVADVLLAVFMGTLFLAWALEIGEHANWIPQRITHH